MDPFATSFSAAFGKKKKKKHYKQKIKKESKEEEEKFTSEKTPDSDSAPCYCTKLSGEESVDGVVDDNEDVVVSEFKIKELEGSCRHIMFFSTLTNSVYIFGGTKRRGDKDVTVNEMFCHNLNTPGWIKVNEKGDVPTPRECCSYVVYDGLLYLFGGRAMNEEYYDRYDDFFSFNPTTETWKKLKLSQKPMERGSAIFFLYENFFYMMGGINDDGDLINLKKIVRIDLRNVNQNEAYDCQIKEMKGNFSSKFLFDTCVLSHGEDGKVFLYGGTSNYKNGYNSIFEVDTENYTINKVDGKSWKALKLPKLFGHYGLFLDEKRVVVFGGFIENASGKRVPNQDFHFFEIHSLEEVEYKTVKTKTPTRVYGDYAKAEFTYYFFGGHKTKEGVTTKRTNELVLFTFENTQKEQIIVTNIDISKERSQREMRFEKDLQKISKMFDEDELVGILNQKQFVGSKIRAMSETLKEFLRNYGFALFSKLLNDEDMGKYGDFLELNIFFDMLSALKKTKDNFLVIHQKDQLLYLDMICRIMFFHYIRVTMTKESRVKLLAARKKEFTDVLSDLRFIFNHGGINEEFKVCLDIIKEGVERFKAPKKFNVRDYFSGSQKIVMACLEKDPMKGAEGALKILSRL